jgi:16S rRNA A1518/A1519 N6-dimethyltransferase RsmA/KsgA/DIM1 with predicted DNA glycosylase/AP lyase activity
LVKEGRQNFAVCVVVVPHRFTKSISATPEDPNFGVLSALFHAFYGVEIVSDVAKESFDPMPRVESHMVRITPKVGKMAAADFILRNLFVRADKKIRNAMLSALWDRGEEAAGRKFTKKEAKEVVDQVDQGELVSVLDKRIFLLSGKEMRMLYKTLGEIVIR